MLLDIVILPPSLVRKKLGKLAVRLSEVFKAKYVVDNNKLIPHLSIFHVNINQKNLNKLIKIVDSIANQTRSFMVKSLDWEIGKFSVGLGFNLPANLKRLNNKIVANCFYLRQGIMPLSFNKQFSLKEQAAIKKYGSLTVGSFYKPHITLGVIIQQSKKVKLPRINFSFPVNQLALCKVNRYYQVTRIIKKFKL